MALGWRPPGVGRALKKSVFPRLADVFPGVADLQEDFLGVLFALSQTSGPVFYRFAPPGEL